MEGGAKVAVLERAPADESGGCTRYTEAFLRLKNEDEVSDDFETAMAECGSANSDPNIMRALDAAPEQWSGKVRATNVTDPEYIATFAREAVPAVQWLKGMGVRAVGKGNKPAVFRAPAVVLANGGFEGSHEMLARYVGLGAANIRPVAPGCHYNHGDGIRMAIDVGAAPSGDYNAYHATPVDERSGRFEAKILIFPYGIVVNKLGRRFTNESSSSTYDNFDRLCYGIQQQRDGIGYVIVDAKINDIPDWRKAVYTDKQPIEAATLEQLARQLDIPVDTFLKTVKDYNAGCRPGNFDPFDGDNLATEGVEPPKFHWARTIEQGPFLCYPVVPSSIITYGGIKTDSSARVLNTEGDRIPGLFAAGALVGVYYRMYAGATSVLRGATFGRIAGREAAAETRAVGHA
jgi:tricarballylate dehydrogenase